MKPLLTLLLVTISIAYPALVYFGVQHISPALFALVVFTLALFKFFASRDNTDKGQLILLIAVGIYSLALLLSNSEYWLKLYPVVISWAVATLFALSLAQPETLIERMARLSGAAITPRAKNYTHKLTGVWALLLVANGLIALYLALFSSMASWALYCGLLSYLIFGLFFAAEYAYRCYYIRKYQEPN